VIKTLFCVDLTGVRTCHYILKGYEYALIIC